MKYDLSILFYLKKTHEEYKREISCVLSCFDRLLLSGTMLEISSYIQ